MLPAAGRPVPLDGAVVVRVPVQDPPCPGPRPRARRDPYPSEAPHLLARPDVRTHPRPAGPPPPSRPRRRTLARPARLGGGPVTRRTTVAQNVPR
ncbi:hypothetical protein Ae263Ps1_0393c [Pseudonocardia sp. Ae263_Ps1]|nr:hypothetical protein Ae150APs1_4916 [Pseudonocardia sp. Ae150A_Ps1]OLL83338.1 hypothetical protein Ae263Ps1_0393c [Pseudonocardia sp. Ae263_Ps1]OLL90624.1 hypothetical protein Ae356Ps1_0521 [Pseudonocardia sp. Ae356_Ps1]